MRSESPEQFDRAVALHQAGRGVEAAAIYRQVLGQNSKHSGAWHLLGVAQHQQGDFAGAIASIGRAIEIDASQAVFYNNYGAALQSQKQFTLAIAAYRAAVQIREDYLDAHLNLARLLEQLGQEKEALKSYERVLAHDPNHVAALPKALALAQRLAHYERAAELLKLTIDQLPRIELEGLSPAERLKRAGLCNDLGGALVGVSRFDEAAKAYEQAVAILPTYANAFFNLASARVELGEIDAARAAFQEASRLAPENAEWKLRLAVLCPTVFPSTKALDDYRGELETELDALLAAHPVVSEPNLLTTGFFPPFAISFQGRPSRPLKEKFAAVCRLWFTPGPSEPRKTDRLRVGFIVTRGHDGVFLRCAGEIVKLLDPERFEPIVFCDQGAVGRIRQGIGRKDLPIVGLNESFREVVERISATECDVLYYWEVGSDALNYFLPFMRLAPVQCTSWGTQVTSGLKEVDYYLSSELIELPEADEHYTERLWRLKSLPTYQRRVPAPPPTTCDYFGLPENSHLYLCPQNLLKLHPDQDALFGQLLRADPAGLLIVKEGRYPYPAQQLRARFAESIPDVIDRVRFIPWQSLDDYYRLISVADVVLDVLYYSAGSSAYDMFSLNQPIVTLSGELNVGRYTQACYRRMGFTDLIATTPDDYVQMAVHLASDANYRLHVRQTLAERTPVLFEDLGAIREHERFFWEAHEARLAAGD